MYILYILYYKHYYYIYIYIFIYINLEQTFKALMPWCKIKVSKWDSLHQYSHHLLLRGLVTVTESTFGSPIRTPL